MLSADVRLGLMPCVIAMARLEVVPLDLRWLEPCWSEVLAEGVKWFSEQVGIVSGGELAVCAADPELFRLHPKQNCLYMAVRTAVRTDDGLILSKSSRRLYRLTPQLRGFMLDRGLF